MLYNASLASDRRETNKVGQVCDLPDARGSAHRAVVQVHKLLCKIEGCVRNCRNTSKSFLLMG